MSVNDDERTARESGLLRLLFEDVPDVAAFSLDPEGRVASWNAGAERMYGWAASEVLGRDAAVLSAPEDRESGVPPRDLRAALDAGRVEAERWQARKDGSRFLAAVATAPVGEGGSLGFARICRDLAGRRRAEMALGADEARPRPRLSAGRDAELAWAMDAKGARTWFDRAWLEFTGKSPDEARAGGPADEAHPEDRLRLLEIYGRALAGRSAYSASYRLRRRDGAWREVVEEGQPQFDEGGGFAGLVASCLDVTDRRAAEERLARDALILANVHDAVVVTDRDGRVAYWNDGAERIFGWPAAEVVGRHYADRFPEADRGWIAEQMRARLEEGTAWVGEYEDRRKDGSRVWIDARVERITDAEGRPTGVLGVSRDVSRRKRIEAELADIKSRMESALEAGAIGTWTWDLAADRFQADASFARLFSASPEDVAGGPAERIVRAIHPDDRDRVTALVARAVETGEPYEADYRVEQPGGAWKWVTARGRVERDAEGRPARFPGVVIDVTARKRAEEALASLVEESERRRRLYEAFLSSSPDLAYVFDLDHRFVYANDVLLRMWGRTWDEAIGKTCLELGYEPWHAAMHDREIEQVKAEGRPVRGEVPFDGAFGRRIYDYIFVPVLGAGGEVEAVAGTTRDVTDRKRAEEEVRRGEERLQMAVAIAEMGTFEIDLEAGAVEVNEPGREIYGWPDRRTTFARLQEHFHPDDRDEVMRRIGAASDPFGPGTFEVEQRIVRADGETRWIRVRGRMLFEGEGPARRAVRCVGAYLDVTDRRVMEQELREADRKKDEFIALLAHELRNPLAPIRNGLQVLRLVGSDADSGRRVRDMMERQLAHMVRLIDDLLDVSRITLNKMELRRAPVTLDEAVAAGVETARPQLDEAGHELSVSLPSPPVRLDADLTRLAQVFANLLLNAAKYTPRGGRIGLKAERVDGGSAVAVSVSDTGVGIPADSLGRVFAMFSQLERAAGRSSGGLGIGLALVKGLVELHGGEVTAASEGPGRGSTFTVRLPALPDPEPPAEPDAPPASAGDARGGGLRVLVVDDNRDGAQSMAEMLRLLGEDARTAFDGLDALEKGEEFRPDLILMDVGMPRLDGLDATRRIRERPWGGTVAIFALTGWGQESDRERSRGAGCDGHLVKPVDFADLEKLLAQLRARP